jgi:hypothetical protein
VLNNVNLTEQSKHNNRLALVVFADWMTNRQVVSTTLMVMTSIFADFTRVVAHVALRVIAGSPVTVLVRSCRMMANPGRHLVH